MKEEKNYEKEELETLRLINTLEKEQQEKLSELGIEATETKNEESENKVAIIVKALSVVIVLSNILISFMLLEEINGLFFTSVGISIIIAIFVYAFGEIIALLQRIVDNTEN